MHRPACLLLALAACAHQSPSQGAILRSRAALEDAFARGDGAAFRAHLFDNAVFCFPGAKEKYVAGADKLAQMTQRLHELRPGIVMHYQPGQIDINETSGLAAERGVWVEQWTEKDGPTELRGPYMGMWRLDGAEWKLQSLLFVPVECDGKSYCSPQPH